MQFVDEPALRVGDLVMLKSGSRPLTVKAVSRSRGFFKMAYADAHATVLETSWLPRAALLLYTEAMQQQGY